MSTDQSSKLSWDEGLVLEHLNQSTSILGRQRHHTLGREAGVLTTDQSEDTGAERADGSSSGRHELNKIGSTDTEGSVFGVQSLSGGNDIVETLIDQSGTLLRVQDKRTISASERRVLRPGTGIVETEANRCASSLVAASVRIREKVGELLGDSIPNTAGVLSACKTS